MLLVIDNFDSFTYNLVQYFGELGENLRVVRNDALTPDEALAWRPARVVISPGPCDPDEAGVSLALLDAFVNHSPHTPLLGVCLGHQCIGQHFGGRIVRASRLLHGKTSPIEHDGRELFEGMPPRFAATRYHSLLIERESLPSCLEITAQTAEGEIMAVRHRELPIWGVQFHPESIATHEGKRLVENFLRLPRNS